MKYDPEKLLFAGDLAGTLLFAIEGATAAISGNLDVLGLMVLAFATALGGGIIRDLLIGAVPPNSRRDWRYSAVVFTGAAIVFFLHRLVRGIPNEVMIVLDAAGLALFAVAGTQKALIYKMHPFIAILLGQSLEWVEGRSATCSWREYPQSCAPMSMPPRPLAGSAAMIVGRKLGLPPTLSAILGGVVCFGLRLVSVWQHWNLPRVAG
jgi:uncharacterized membrane protein YeiH